MYIERYLTQDNFKLNILKLRALICFTFLKSEVKTGQFCFIFNCEAKKRTFSGPLILVAYQQLNVTQNMEYIDLSEPSAFASIKKFI